MKRGPPAHNSTPHYYIASALAPNSRRTVGVSMPEETPLPEKSTMSGSNPIELAAGVVAAFVSNNSVPVGELPALIQAVHTSVKRLAEGSREHCAASRGEGSSGSGPQVGYAGVFDLS